MTALFIIIFLLTIADAVCTAVGVSHGVINEGNVLMQTAMTSYPVLTAVAVCLIIGGILYLMWRVRKRIKWMPRALIGILAVKIGILGMHGYWIANATALNLW